MVRTTFLTAAILAGLSGVAPAIAGCDGNHGTTAGDYTPAPLADATDGAATPVIPPVEGAAETDEG